MTSKIHWLRAPEQRTDKVVVACGAKLNITSPMCTQLGSVTCVKCLEKALSLAPDKHKPWFLERINEITRKATA